MWEREQLKSALGLVERAPELRVAIVDEEPEKLLILELHGEVARRLGDPASVRL